MLVSIAIFTKTIHLSLCFISSTNPKTHGGDDEFDNLFVVVPGSPTTMVRLHYR